MKTERNAEIVRRYLAGESSVALAAEYGLTANGILLVLTRAGAPRRRQGPQPRRIEKWSARSRAILADYIAGMTRQEIAAKHGVSPQWVSELLYRAGAKERKRGI